MTADVGEQATEALREQATDGPAERAGDSVGQQVTDGMREQATDGAAERAGDAELVAGFRRDPELFCAVYDRYFRDIYLYVAGRLDVQAADDLAAETFLTAFRGRDKFNPERGGLRPWLFGIATNMVARHRRREARHYRTLSLAAPEPAVDSHETQVVTTVAAQSMQPQLARGLGALNQGERDVILLVALAQLSHEEVAQALDISYGTVGSRLSRARRKLHNSINQEAVNG